MSNSADSSTGAGAGTGSPTPVAEAKDLGETVFTARGNRPTHAEQRARESRYQSLFEHLPDGILIASPESYYLDANPSMCRMLGYTREELIGLHASNIVEPAEIAHIGTALNLIKAKNDYHREWRFRRKDHSTFLAEVIATQMPDGNILGLVRDITERQAREQEIARLSRLYSAMSQVNQAIAWTTAREELLQKICRILVEQGGFHMAWIGWHDPQTQLLAPVADWGDQNGYLRSIKIYADDRPEGRGPSGTAFRSGRPCICSDLLNDPISLPWRAELARRGFHASAALPIRLRGQVCAILSVYADEPFFFKDKEVTLLEEAANDISFALDNIQREEERQQAEAIAKGERLFSDTMIDCMPGILYFYDEQGRFLRWNRNFETVSGYAREEIARMHPLDFFPDEEKPLLQQRIAKVFATGEATVEAAFKSRDGRTTPYFFTGKRVEFNGAVCLVGVGIDISERKQAEQALGESERKLRALFEQAPLGIAVIDTATGRFRKLNPQYCKIAGYAEAEMLELTYHRITHPDDLGEDAANMQRLQAGAIHAFQMEKRYVRPDGSIVWVNLTCVPLWENQGSKFQHIAMVEDITERKLAAGRLEESERKYRELVELANSIILRWNSQGRVTFLNEFGQRFFGYRAEEIIGRRVVDTIVPPTESGGRDLGSLMEQICADPAAFEQNVNENMRRNGERVFIAWTNRIVRDDGGGIVEILSVGTDITESRRASDTIRELNASLERRVAERTEELAVARDRAEAADRIKSAFLATMSHELRTPLNSIIGFTGIILQGLAGPLNPEQGKQLGMVRGSARHLLELINDVLDLSKIEAGQLQVRSEQFDLRASLEKVAASVKPLAEKKKLALITEISPQLHAIVGDRRRVEQILLNLLNNAIKFTEQGSVTLIAEINADGPASPEASPGASVRLRVIDTGIGIKPEDLDQLFQPFRQIDSGLARQHDGTGLGLAICRRLATLMGGEISAKSEWSKGSEFVVTLPLQPPPAL
jgi:PAS domain S-box-containing protein